jgi:hypothetical protein
LVIRQTDGTHLRIRRLLAQQRGAGAAARAAGRQIDLAAHASDSMQTTHYTLDAQTATELASTLPAMIAPGTWEGAGRGGDGQIWTVAAGRRIVELPGKVAETGRPDKAGASAPAEGDDSESPDNQSDATEVLVIPQAKLIIRHRRSVQREVRRFLEDLFNPWSHTATEGKLIGPGVTAARGGFGHGSRGAFD